MKRKALYLLLTGLTIALTLGAGPAGAASGAEPGKGNPGAPVEPDPEEQMTDLVEFETDRAENPDNLERPTEIDAPVLFYPPPSKSRLSSPAIRGTAGSDEDGNIEPWGNPGSLKLNKTAVPVEGTANRWLITLTLEGKDVAVETTSDIVLVIDTSGSMQGTRISAARDAAKKFVNSLLKDGDPSTRIAVISFASDVTVHNNQSNQPFRDATGKGDLLGAINALNANGGTFTQAGLRQARLLLDSSTADNRNIVLLSDGEPTYSYQIIDVYNKLDQNHFYDMGLSGYRYLGFRPIYDYHARDDLDQSEYNNNSVAGNGSSMTALIKTVTTGSLLNYTDHDYYYHHGNSAVAESNYIRDGETTIYSVGLETGADGQDILDRIASRVDLAPQPKTTWKPFSRISPAASPVSLPPGTLWSPIPWERDFPYPVSTGPTTSRKSPLTGAR